MAGHEISPGWSDRGFNVGSVTQGNRRVNLVEDCTASYPIFKLLGGISSLFYLLRIRKPPYQKLDYGVPRGTGVVYHTRKELVVTLFPFPLIG